MKIYPVKERDTLWKIARENSVTVEQLAAANGLKGRRMHLLRIGQKLYIPDDSEESPDAILKVQFKGLDHQPFTPREAKVEHDGQSVTHSLDEEHGLMAFIKDHAKGLKIWIRDLAGNFVNVYDRQTLPLGQWSLSIDSRAVRADGQLQAKNGPQAKTTENAVAATTHNAQQAKGVTAQEQARIEGGRPAQILASIYTEENLRLAPGNEPYRKFILNAARRYGLTPQSLAALIDAEAAVDKNGVWKEKSNAHDPTLAQGLAQFFEPAWTDVLNFEKSLLHERFGKLKINQVLRRRLEAEYAIDGAGAYATINLSNFQKKTNYDVESLPAEDKAKLAYLLHHEGLTGALRLVGLAPERSEADARTMLWKQLGKSDAKTARVIAQYGGSSNEAYMGWLFSYVDSKINVANFIVKDKAAFAKPPRDMADILSALKKTRIVVKPVPRPSKPKSSPPPASQTPPKQPAQPPRSAAPTPPAGTAPTPAGTGSSNAKWFDPLATCTLRNKGLSSVLGAKFGMTRNGGKSAHQGIDLVANPGTPIVAVADGTVYPAPAPSPGYDYGNSLVLEVNIDDLPPHQAEVFKRVNPHRKTIGFFYAHLNEIAFTKPTPVFAGAIIGKTGNTGNAKNMTTIEKGAHLHFEARLDALLRCGGLTNRTDPLQFIENCTNR
jgi:murein DD-endopeptidase MepM/ murein hydrolase activator NlpD